MPKKRFSWQKQDSSEGGWQNADFEFTQLDFSDTNPNVTQASSSTEFIDQSSDVDDDYVNCGPEILPRCTHFIETPFHQIAPSNPSHYLCTLLPSRKVYIGNPELEHTTLARKRTLTSEKSSNMATIAGRRPGISRGVKYEFSEDDTDFKADSVMSDQDYWEQVLAIKAMAAPIHVKKQYKEKLQKSAAMNKASSSNLWRKLVKNKQNISDFTDNFKKDVNLWKNPLKVIEGYYGTGIVSYFIFIRWLLMLNFIMFLLIFIFVILPPLVFEKVAVYQIVSVDQTSTNFSAPVGINETSPVSVSSEWYSIYENSSLKYKDHVKEITQNDFKSQLQDFLQGTGWMELTVMFYGSFSPNNLLLGYFTGHSHWYMLPLSYLIVTIVYFSICLIMMVRSMIEGSRESLVLHEAQFNRYFNLIFGGWDFCITDGNSAELKKMSIYVELQSNLKEDAIIAKEDQRTTGMKLFVYFMRTFLNLLSLGMLIGAGYLIYFVTIQSVEIYQYHAHELNKFVVLLVEFLTPITITSLNILLPILFKFMVQFEQYRPNFALSITLFRSVFVRLASLAVLMSTFSSQITCDVEKDKDCVELLCWETYVGQQMYKLVIVDFLVVMVTTFFVETPRRIIVNTFSSVKLFNMIGKPQFDIAKHVLDLIYGQTLCWLGVFYCPMLPAIGVLKCIIFFYVKKFTLISNCKPTLVAYKASRSNTFFTVILFVAFLLTCIPLVYSFLNFPPSKGCGPFRLDENIWGEVIQTVHHWPTVLRQILAFIGTAGFAIPFFIILCLLIYYYSMILSAHKELALAIKEQLKEEGRDKQYLLARLTQQS